MRHLLLALALLLSPPVWAQGFSRVYVNEVVADDSEPDSDLDGADIDAAIASCPGSGGCLVRLLPETYSNVAIHLVPGDVPDWLDIVGFGDKTLLQAPVPQIAPVFRIDDGASHITIAHMKLDGRKDEQPPMECTDAGTGDTCVDDDWCTGTCTATSRYHEAAGVIIEDDFSVEQSEDISIHHVTMVDFLQAGIWARDLLRANFYENNVSDIGCHTSETDCSAAWNSAYTAASVIGCPPSANCVGDDNAATCDGGDRSGEPCCKGNICSPPDEFEPQPGRRANGFGVILLNNSEGVIARDNTATRVSKETFEVFRHNAVTDYPREIRWYGNTSIDSDGPFTAVGCNPDVDSCASGPTDIHWIGNTATRPGMGTSGTGQYGFACSGRGHDMFWRGNSVTDGVSGGYSIGCWKDLRLEGNSSNNNCGTYTGQVELGINPSDWPAGQRQSNVAVLDHSVTSTTGCTTALEIEDVDGLLMRGGTWSDLNSPAVTVVYSSGVYLDEVSMTGPGSGTGIDADDGAGTTTGIVQTSMNDTDCGSGGCLNSFTTRVDNAGASGFVACTGTGVPDADCE